MQLTSDDASFHTKVSTTYSFKFCNWRIMLTLQKLRVLSYAADECYNKMPPLYSIGNNRRLF